MKKQNVRQQTAAAAAAQEAPRGWWGTAEAGWQALSPLEKLGVVVMGLLLLPMLRLVINRLFVPFEIDSSAYYLMHVVERVRLGQPVYVPTSPTGTSVVYTPLYFLVSGWLTKIFGSGFAIPRLVSLLGTLWTAGILARWTWRITDRSLLLAAAAPTFLILSNSFATPWCIDIMVNALFLAFAVTAFYVLHLGETRRHIILSAVLVALAVMTKQTGVGLVVSVSVLLLLRNRPAGLLFAGASGGLVGLLVFLLNATTGGLFQRFIKAAGLAPWLLERVWDEVLFPDLLGSFGLMSAAAVLLLVLTPRGRFWATVARPEIFLLASGLAIALIAQPKFGSGRQQALLVYAGLSLCGCWGLARLSTYLEAGIAAKVRAGLVILQGIVLALPLVTGLRYMLIDQYDVAKYNEIGAYFRLGPTFLYGYAYLGSRFGQPETGPGGDEFIWKNGRIDYSDVDPKMYERFKKQQFDYVIIGAYSQEIDPNVRAIVENYQGIRRIGGHPRGPRGGNLRYDYIVFKAKRLVAQAPPAR